MLIKKSNKTIALFYFILFKLYNMKSLFLVNTMCDKTHVIINHLMLFNFITNIDMNIVHNDASKLSKLINSKIQHNLSFEKGSDLINDILHLN